MEAGGTSQEASAIFQGGEDGALYRAVVMEAVKSGQFWRPLEDRNNATC